MSYTKDTENKLHLVVICNKKQNILHLQESAKNSKQKRTTEKSNTRRYRKTRERIWEGEEKGIKERVKINKSTKDTFLLSTTVHTYKQKTPKTILIRMYTFLLHLPDITFWPVHTQSGISGRTLNL